MSSSTPETATALARKAEGDARAARYLAGVSKIPDGIVGFHAQQAVEKWLKAAIVARPLSEARIHDIGRLLQILENSGAELPAVAGQLDELTIYAIPMRYDEILLEVEPLDRDATVALLDSVETWAIGQIRK